jgi:hypothetical protein
LGQKKINQKERKVVTLDLTVKQLVIRPKSIHKGMNNPEELAGIVLEYIIGSDLE